MKGSSVLPVIVLLAAVVCSSWAPADTWKYPVDPEYFPSGDPPSEDPWCIDPDDGHTFLAGNETGDGFNVSLAAAPSPTWYAGEDVNISVYVTIPSTSGQENDGVDILVGLDGLGAPDCAHHAHFNGTTDGGEPYEPFHYAEATVELTMEEGPVRVMAQARFQKGTVNVTFEGTVEPPRTLLRPEVVEPWNGSYPEQEWTNTRLLIVNDGGLAATNLVLDVRYDDRIVDTFDIPLVPARGNRSLEFTLFPIHGEEAIHVVPVTGPQAGSPMPAARIWVVERTLLDIESLEVTPSSLEDGKKVRIEAVVRNLGNATASGQVVELMVDGSVVANETITGLGPGETTTVSATRTLRGEGLHTVSAVAEGEDLAAEPVAVEVKGSTPSLGTWAAVLALLSVSLAARRSPPARRA